MVNAKVKQQHDIQSSQRIASLSLDLDNQWSYMKTHGDTDWKTYPSYLDCVVPRVLDLLHAHQLTITVFIVGQDAALDKNRKALRAIADQGHEIGNHSFRHEPWLHLYSDSELEEELALAETHIEAATGQRPTGFRGPGFSLSPATLRLLKQRGYHYDASTFPTYLGPLARAYYFMTSRLDAEEKEQRKLLFGTWRDGLRSLKPYLWDLGGDSLIEIPVTTMPLLKIPIHISYLLYLSVVSPGLAVMYFKFALALCRLTRTQPSLLLHPLDFLGCDDDLPALSFFPAMGLTSTAKVSLVDRVLRLLAADYTILPVGTYAERTQQHAPLPTRLVDTY